MSFKTYANYSFSVLCSTKISYALQLIIYYTNTILRYHFLSNLLKILLWDSPEDMLTKINYLSYIYWQFLTITIQFRALIILLCIFSVDWDSYSQHFIPLDDTQPLTSSWKDGCIVKGFERPWFLCCALLYSLLFPCFVLAKQWLLTIERFTIRTCAHPSRQFFSSLHLAQQL